MLLQDFEEEANGVHCNKSPVVEAAPKAPVPSGFNSKVVASGFYLGSCGETVTPVSGSFFILVWTPPTQISPSHSLRVTYRQ